MLKFIDDFKNAGADILRFTFLQEPRGYTLSEDEKVIINRNKKDLIMQNLKEVIENENSEKCKVLILIMTKTWT